MTNIFFNGAEVEDIVVSKQFVTLNLNTQIDTKKVVYRLIRAACEISDNMDLSDDIARLLLMDESCIPIEALKEKRCPDEF